jgi:hypothetical protein
MGEKRRPAGSAEYSADTSALDCRIGGAVVKLAPSARSPVYNIANSAALLLVFGLVAGRASAAPPDAAGVVRGFYATLLETMRNGPALGPSGRYAKLDPVVRRTFDIPFMTRLAMGPSWASLPAEQVMQTFARYVAATYADRFDSYSGEKLEVAGERPFGPASTSRAGSSTRTASRSASIT